MQENLQQYISQIKKHFPDFAFEQVELEQEGQFNTVLVINQEWVFRFPKYGFGIDLMNREIAVLEMLKPHLPLLIPEARYIHIDWDCVRRTFMGYQMIVGQPLYRNIWATLNTEKKKEIISDLSHFLKSLHRIEEPSIVSVLFEADQLEKWKTMFDELSKYIFPLISPQSCKEIQAGFQKFFSDHESHLFTPVIRHGDFGPSNIIFDGEPQAVTGIIDFSSIALGDPAVDLASLSCLGPEVMEYLPKTYPISDTIMRRMTFYKSTFALQEALAGYKTKDENALKRGIAAYQ